MCAIDRSPGRRLGVAATLVLALATAAVDEVQTAPPVPNPPTLEEVVVTGAPIALARAASLIPVLVI